MKKLSRIAAVAMLVLFAATVFSQEWTKEQSEVWKTVEDGWKAWKSGDEDGVAKVFHEKYQGWSDELPLPSGKASTLAWYKEMKGKMKIESFFLEPARIVVLKNAAVVDYYYELYMTYTLGEKPESKATKGKNAEFYVKEGDKWLLLGDMGVHLKDK